LLVQFGVGAALGGAGIAQAIARLEHGHHGRAFIRAVGQRQEPPAAIERSSIGRPAAYDGRLRLTRENLGRRAQPECLGVLSGLFVARVIGAPLPDKLAGDDPHPASASPIAKHDPPVVVQHIDRRGAIVQQACQVDRSALRVRHERIRTDEKCPCLQHTRAAEEATNDRGLLPFHRGIAATRDKPNCSRPQ
jgi:hypothetical protein